MFDLIIMLYATTLNKCELYIPICERSVQAHKIIIAFCMVPLFRLGTFFESHGNHVCAQNILQHVHILENILGAFDSCQTHATLSYLSLLLI